MYHGIRKTNQRINGRHIRYEQFELQLRYFKRHFNIVPLREICSMKFQGITPERHTIALSFDDGFLNNLTVALPLLEKYDIPATFFICAAPFQNIEYLHPSDLIDLVRISSENSPVNLGGVVFKSHNGRITNIENGLSGAQYVRSLTFSELKRLLKEPGKRGALEMSGSIDREIYSLIDEQSVKRISTHPLATIGSHSYHHLNLRCLDSAEVDTELLSSKQILENYATEKVDLLAFPYGEYDTPVVESAIRNGYKYLIAGGDVSAEFASQVFPRMGVPDGAGFAFTILSVNKGFNRFGF